MMLVVFGMTLWLFFSVWNQKEKVLDFEIYMLSYCLPPSQQGLFQ